MADADALTKDPDGDAQDRPGAVPDKAAPDDPPPGLGRELVEGRTSPTLAAALIAWAVTLAPVGFARGSPPLAIVLSITALAAGLGGPLLARSRPRAGRHVGI